MPTPKFWFVLFQSGLVEYSRKVMEYGEIWTLFKFHSVLTCDLDKLLITWACSLNLYLGQDVNVLCKPRNSTKGNFLLVSLMFVLNQLVLRGCRRWVSPRNLPFCPSWCPPVPMLVLSFHGTLSSGDAVRQEWHDNFFALCPGTLISRGFCLLGQWAPEAGVCREWLRLHLPREQELDPPMSLELWTGES